MSITFGIFIVLIFQKALFFLEGQCFCHAIICDIVKVIIIYTIDSSINLDF